ncbi:MAG: glycosyltransferase family 4 protein [Archangium sp.]|nr:glycosyltransferase family 4 protein [Archangium sp.]
MAHLVFVVNNADFLVSHRLVLVEGAMKAGYRVTVVAPEGPGLHVLEKVGCEIAPWKLRRTGQRPHEEAIALAHLGALYRSLKPDLVHHITVKAMLYGSLAARANGVRAVVNAVSGLGYVFLSSGLRAQVRRQVLRAGYRMALTTPGSAVILQNDDDEASLRSLGVLDGARVVKIRGSGVDLSRFPTTPEPSGVPLVVLPARLLVDKGVREFVEAAQLLGKVARFALVGGEDEGNPAGVPRAELDRWVDEGIVEWWGHRTDMPEVLRQAHVVCLPSYREGMPKALLEAAAMGRAIVTTDVAGCRDAVAGGAIGRLVPVRNAHALAAVLGELIASAPERKRWGDLASAHARENFSEDRVLASHLELYASLLLG